MVARSIIVQGLEMNRNVLLLVSIASLVCLGGPAATAQSCMPGPQCTNADMAAQSRIAGYQARLAAPSVHIASEAAYCTNMAVVEAARACESEFRAQGNGACAEIAAQQAVASDQAARSALQSAGASAAAGNWSPQC